MRPDHRMKLAPSAIGLCGHSDRRHLGLAYARVERGNDVGGVTARRVALLATLGGAAPPPLCAALGMMFGAPPAALLSLLGLGAISASRSVLLATSSQAAATRAALTGSQATPRSPTT